MDATLREFDVLPTDDDLKPMPSERVALSDSTADPAQAVLDLIEWRQEEAEQIERHYTRQDEREAKRPRRKLLARL